MSSPAQTRVAPDLFRSFPAPVSKNPALGAGYGSTLGPLDAATRMMRAAAKWAALAAGLLLAMPTGAATAQTAYRRPAQMVQLKYAATGISFSTAPLIVATVKGFFQEENIKLDFVMAGQSASVCQQLLARAVELGECSLNDVMQIVQMSNAPLIMASNQVVAALNYGMMAKPAIKTWKDLKGKTIIVGGPKDNTVFFTRVMARPNGLADSEYQFQYAGASGARFAALKSGAVDAAILTDPFDSEAEISGYIRLDDLRPKYLSASNYTSGGLITTRDWAKAHPDELVAVIRGFGKAFAWIYDPANKDELFEILKTRINATREAFERTYQRNVVRERMWATGGGVAVDSAVQGVADSLVDIGALPKPAPPAAKFYDNTWAVLAEKSGL
jgi:NitT/TauT family transport system substrate-binding protein